MVDGFERDDAASNDDDDLDQHPQRLGPPPGLDDYRDSQP
jgi:hypothetical protein